MVIILSVILGRADHMQEQMDNVSREMKTLRQNLKYVRKKKHKTEKKNTCTGIVSRLGKLKDVSEIS